MAISFCFHLVHSIVHRLCIVSPPFFVIGAYIFALGYNHRGHGQAQVKLKRISKMKEIGDVTTREGAGNAAGKEVINLTEAASYMGISKAYLYKLTSQRMIPHYKPTGKMIYFNRIELEGWLQRNRVSTAAEIAGAAHRMCNNSR